MILAVIMMYAVESNAPAAGSEEDVDDEAKSVERQEQMCAYVRSLWLFRRSAGDGVAESEQTPHSDPPAHTVGYTAIPQCQPDDLWTGCGFMEGHGITQNHRPSVFVPLTP